MSDDKKPMQLGNNQNTSTPAASTPKPEPVLDKIPEVASKKEAVVVGDANTAKKFTNLNNKNRFSITVASVTGDSIMLPPGTHLVPGHFNWNLPSGVKEV